MNEKARERDFGDDHEAYTQVRARERARACAQVRRFQEAAEREREREHGNNENLKDDGGEATPGDKTDSGGDGAEDPPHAVEVEAKQRDKTTVDEVVFYESERVHPLFDGGVAESEVMAVEQLMMHAHEHAWR